MNASAPLNYDDYPRSILRSEPYHEPLPGLVESLDSYGERLGIAHNVQRRSLEFVVLAKPQTAIYASRHCQHSRGPSIWTDSPVEASVQYAARLEEMTQQPGVAKLGLGWMHKCITSAGALRASKAWCPMCLRESFTGRRPLYVPLLWHLTGCDVCVVHRTWLQSSCPRCRAKFPRCSGSRIPMQQCPQCSHHLSDDDRATDQSNQLMDEAIWAAEALADMLCKLRALPPEEGPVQPDLRTAIKSAAARNLCRSTNEFLALAGIPKGTYSSLLNGGKASLLLWLQVAMAADISLAGLFSHRYWHEDVRGEAIRWRPLLSARKLTKPLPWNKIQDEARSQMAAQGGETVRELGRRLNIDANHLRQGLGDLAAELDADAKAKKARVRASATEALAQELLRAKKSLKEACVRVSGRALAKRLGLSRHSVQFAAAMQLLNSK